MWCDFSKMATAPSVIRFMDFLIAPYHCCNCFSHLYPVSQYGYIFVQSIPQHVQPRCKKKKQPKKQSAYN